MFSLIIRKQLDNHGKTLGGDTKKQEESVQPGCSPGYMKLLFLSGFTFLSLSFSTKPHNLVSVPASRQLRASLLRLEQVHSEQGQQAAGLAWTCVPEEERNWKPPVLNFLMGNLGKTPLEMEDNKECWKGGRGKKWGQLCAISFSEYPYAPIPGSSFLGEVVLEETSKAGTAHTDTAPASPEDLVQEEAKVPGL